MEHLRYLGISEQRANETLKNENLCDQLRFISELAQDCLGKQQLTAQKGNLLYHLGSRLKSQKQQVRESLRLTVKNICNGDIKNDGQLNAAIDYLNAHVVSGVTEEDLRSACGAGVTVTCDQIEDKVAEVINKFRVQLLKERYRFNTGRLMADVKDELPWADGSLIKKEVDLRVLELLGPRTLEELQPFSGKNKKPKSGSKTEKTKHVVQEHKSHENGPISKENCFNEETGASTMEELLRKKVHFHKPGENYKTDGYIVTSNTMHLLSEHLAKTGGKVITRFPPEPNGILHIGHAKAININFGYAKACNGLCYLRYDDTNPEKEEEKFFTGIKDMVNWLGYEPAKITHSSDYFDTLYLWAIELIKKELAYVCHQTVEQMRGFEVQSSPWRDRPVEESLQLFQDMRRGKIGEGEATLRLKLKMEEGKMDPVAYRIKFVPHHRTASKWCIYPTYDYTHCLCDSIENISHSLCTKEFQSRRSSYYWLCNALDIYCPVQWEYGRLNMSYTVVSKRKIQALIDHKIVKDWDDPRLYTLSALRRRGVPAEAVNSFVAGLGLSVAQMTIEPHVLDSAVREWLDVRAPRTMAVLEPLKVTIINWSDLKAQLSVETLEFPAMKDRSSKRRAAFDSTLYIERTDFRQKVETGFKRFTPYQLVGLKYVGYVLKLVKALEDQNGTVTELKVTAEILTDKNKPKAFIHWVSRPLRCEARLYDRLFKHKNPEDTKEVPGGFLTDCNPNSLRVLDCVLIDRSMGSVAVYERFQFERMGFFSVDPDSSESWIIFNRTITLKEDIGKN